MKQNSANFLLFCLVVISACRGCENEPERDALPENDELAAFTREALSALPISWTDLVVHGRYHRHNPDFFDCVIELFAQQDSNFVTLQDRTRDRALSSAGAPLGIVLSDAAFASHYERPTHRVMWVMNPILSRERDKGLLVVQVEDGGPKGADVVDHWILMQRNESGDWQRRPIPAHLRSKLYLDDETGGGPLATGAD